VFNIHFYKRNLYSSLKKVCGTPRLGKLIDRGAIGNVFEGFVADADSKWKKVAVKQIRGTECMLLVSVLSSYFNLYERQTFEAIFKVLCKQHSIIK
jgi:hypothetical protein